MSPRIIVAGNSRAATEVIDLLVGAVPADALLAVAPPPSTRHSWQPSLAEHARSVGVSCLEPVDVNAGDVVEAVAAHRADLLLSVYYTQIFRPPVLGAVEGPALNFHPALLPRHRGTAPLIWAIVEGDEMTGVTVHHIDDGVDTGPVVVQHPLPIHPDDTGYTLHQKAALLVRATAADLLRTFLAGRELPSGYAQAGTGSTHRSRDGTLNHIDWNSPRVRIRNLVRALAAPLPAAFGLLDGRPLQLQRLEPVPLPAISPKPPGMVEFRLGNPVPIVWAADGPLEIRQYVEEGEVLDGATLAARRGITEGQILG